MPKRSRMSRKGSKARKIRLKKDNFKSYNPYDEYDKNQKNISKRFNKLIASVKKTNIVKKINNNEYSVKTDEGNITVKMTTSPKSTPPYKTPVIYIGGNFSINSFDDESKLQEAKKYIKLYNSKNFLDKYTTHKVDVYSKGKASIIKESRRFVIIKLPDGKIGLHMKTPVDSVGITEIQDVDLNDYHKGFHKELNTLLDSIKKDMIK